MPQITMTIPGIPIAKKRPRFMRRGKFVQTYNCQESEEGRFMWQMKSRYPHAPIPAGTGTLLPLLHADPSERL
jgi:hypothetical protein